MRSSCVTTTLSSSSLPTTAIASSLDTNCGFFTTYFPRRRTLPSSILHSHPPFLLRVKRDGSNYTSDRGGSWTAEDADGSSNGSGRSEADRIVDGMDFGELCNEFECISSPLVESTARQLLRDILELRQSDRALSCYAVSVRYKDPVRSFTGRDKYKRPLWATAALHNPSVTVQETVMLSTSLLNIKWTIKGKPKSFIASVGGDLIIMVNSLFTLNQISGQVIEHEESWDLSYSSAIGQAFFWASRRLFATTEAVKDLGELLKHLTSQTFAEKENREIYPDLSGDPTKFFQRDDNLQRDAYQLALFLAVLYLVVQFLRTTL